MEEIQTTPRVTALVVCRNAVDDLRRCLAALEQSAGREAIEIIVVDSGSRDGSATLDREFPAAQFLRLPKNFGLNRALNIGTRTAKGEFLFILTPDAHVAPDTVTRLAERLESNGSVGAVCPYVQKTRRLPSADDLWETLQNRALPAGIAVDPGAQEVEVEYPAGAPLMLRRGFLRGMNYIDARFTNYWIDAEICYQLRSAGKKILVLPDVRLAQTPSEPAVPNETAHLSDLALGGAAYLSKHHGSGFGFRMRAILRALTGFNLGLFTALVSGQRIDGTHE